VQARLLADEAIELPAPVEEALYHITLEALNNALRHARATSVRVTLSQRDGPVILEIMDDGCGFDPESVDQAGMGLTTMRQRAESIGGRLTVTSKPGAGTRVRVNWEGDEAIAYNRDLPLPPPSDSDKEPTL
jgi:signal transduction histidine kinase